MNIGIISVRYAHALYEYAKSKNVEDYLYNSMKQLLHTFGQIKELNTVITNPLLAKKEKITLLANAAGATDSFEFIRFTELILKNHREEIIPFIANSYIHYYRKKKNIKAVKFITTSPLTDVSCEKIIQRIRQKYKAEVELTTHIDKSIIGGFIYKIDSYELNASVVNQLRLVEQKLVERNRRIL